MGYWLAADRGTSPLASSQIAPGTAPTLLGAGATQVRMREVDLVGSFIWRVVGPLSPSWRTRLMWARARGHDRAGKAVVDEVVKRGDITIDIGANFGLYTDRLARLVGPEGTVYAFEPHPQYKSTLTRIAAAHGNVTFIASALSDQSGTAKLSVPAPRGKPIEALGSLQSRPAAPNVEVVEVPTTTADSAIGGSSSIGLVKCDVEGHEHEVLLGAKGLLRRAKPILLIEIEQRHRARAVSETFDLLSIMGYEGYMLTLGGLRPLADFDTERHQLSLIADDPSTPSPPEEYVHDFVFLPPERALPTACW